jgi:phosphatidylglycerol:prolipoprotein diacylglycerol transferase
MDLLILGLLWKLLGRVKPDGSIFLLYLAIYSAGRFFLSFLRLDSNTVLLGLNQPQWLSIIVLAIVLPMLLLLWQSSRNKLRA